MTGWPRTGPKDPRHGRARPIRRHWRPMPSQGCPARLLRDAEDAARRIHRYRGAGRRRARYGRALCSGPLGDDLRGGAPCGRRVHVPSHLHLGGVVCRGCDELGGRPRASGRRSARRRARAHRPNGLAAGPLQRLRLGRIVARKLARSTPVGRRAQPSFVRRRTASGLASAFLGDVIWGTARPREGRRRRGHSDTCRPATSLERVER